MSHEYDPKRLDVGAFAGDAGVVSGNDLLQNFERLTADAQGVSSDSRVVWAARGELRPVHGASPEIWVHLTARAVLPMVCQRCLGAVDVEARIVRSFRFAADEVQAAAQDEDCEEDVLVLSRDFNLHDLVEDELLMALPLVPRHEACPQEPKMHVADASFESEPEVTAHPFALLARLHKGKSS